MENFLRDLLIVILARCGSLPRTNLVKSVYLIDWEYAKRHGTTFTGLTYQFYNYGPYAPEITDTGTREDLGFQVVPHYSYSGRLSYIHALVDSSLMDKVSLPPEAWYVVDLVVERVDYRNLEDLLEYVYSTEPMTHANRGEVLDMTKGQESEIRRKMDEARRRARQREARCDRARVEERKPELSQERLALLYAQRLPPEGDE